MIGVTNVKKLGAVLKGWIQFQNSKFCCDNFLFLITMHDQILNRLMYYSPVYIYTYSVSGVRTPHLYSSVKMATNFAQESYQ